MTERELRRRGYGLVAGADEAGRGSLFGPVFAAAVTLDPEWPVRSLNDSKQLLAPRREVLAGRIRQRAITWRVAAVDAATIDRINIYQASRLAMKLAIEALSPAPDYVICDALTLDIAAPQKGIIKGDARCHAIAAASILAKVERDRCMAAWEQVYPGYGLAQHKGYPTPEHQEALERLGPTPLHRLSYAPVRACSRFPVDWNQLTLFEPDECP
ncbi:MAG: ribonuclease HII [Bryobacteraceae bacterium]